MKLLKNIFSRRSSIWLALELVLVTIACWWALDPVLVTSYVTHLPLGYDADRLVLMEVGSTMPRQEGIQSTGVFTNEETQLMEKLQEMDAVEKSFLAYNNTIGSGSMSIGGIFYTKLGEDSLYAFRYGFMPDSKMFEVMGIQSITPGIPTSELTHDCEWDKSIIITRSMAMKLFGTTDVAGRALMGSAYQYNEEEHDFEWGKVEYKVRAVVEDVRYSIFDRELTTAFICEGGPSYNIPIVVRLREGVDANWFVQAYQQQVEHDLVAEHCYVRKMSTYQEISNREFDRTHGREMRRNLLIAAFFGLNLGLGVFGTLLMYTRQRREEAGVKRAFGATRWSVFMGFLAEAWLLTTVSVVVGCMIYFQFAANSSLYDFFNRTNAANPLWFDDFGTHFLVVSAFVYLFVLGIVLIGTAIPAWRICRSKITNALKDE